MSITLLRTFVAIVDTDSFQAAADRVFVSPAAVSQQMRTLEANFHANLFDRSRRTPQLTAQGRALVPKAREVLRMYDEMLASPIADVNHISAGGFGGAITAALFLRRFVKKAKSWSHMDMMAWADKPRPGRPLGGTEQGQRAAYLALKKRFG